MKPCATRIFSLPQNHSCHSPFSQSHQKDSRSPLTISVLYIKESESESHSAMFNSLRPHVLYSPWNFPGQNTGVGSLSLLQGIFPTQESNPGLPHCRRILYQLSHQGSPCVYTCICVFLHVHLCIFLCVYWCLFVCVFLCFKTAPYSPNFCHILIEVQLL